MKLLDTLNSYEMILIGIGEEFEEKFTDLVVEDDLSNIYCDLKRKEYLEKSRETKQDLAYKKLEQLIREKDYFIVTLCQDDKIYNTCLDREKIVAPCGSFSKLQCSDVCTDEIYSLDDYRERIASQKTAYCPHCGKELVTNRINAAKYSEEGYLKQWGAYTKWLQGTLNKKLLIIELGVGLKFPSVIRWPFEKTCFINEKSRMIRVHNFLYQMTEEIKEKGIGIQEDPIDFLLNQIV